MPGLAVVVAGLLLAQSALARPVPESFADLAERLTPAVVNISTSLSVSRSGRSRPDLPVVPPGSPFEEFFREFLERHMQPEEDNPLPRATSLGSGFIIDPEGYVVTSNHVTAQADEITVILHDDRRMKAKVVGRDPKMDLALLKLDTDEELPHVSFGDSDSLRVGDWVLAIGNPFGFGNTVTAGIISARARDINAGPYDNFLQTDAPINKGNSGGPLFNMDGQVIGVNTAIFSPSGGSVGIGFAVPAALAEPVIRQLRSYGRTRRGWLGVRVQTVTEEIAEALKLDETKGALVASVSEGGPAEEAGIEGSDLILKFDGKDISTMRVLPRVVAETEIGKRVEVVVLRQGEELTFEVELGELEEAEQMAALGAFSGRAKAEEAESLGMTLAAITPDLRERFALGEETEGVLITEIEEQGPAAETGVLPGDVIVEVAHEEVFTPAQVVAKVDEAREANYRTVLILVSRQGDRRYVGIRLDEG
ncbi:MAG: DegQ family serine endoprotease [Alphaproteobacteria bacterium]